jgi:hypothetical protein
MGRADLALFERTIKRIKASKKRVWSKQELLLLLHEVFVAHVEEGRRLAKLKYGNEGGLDRDNVAKMENLVPRDIREGNGALRRPRGF